MTTATETFSKTTTAVTKAGERVVFPYPGGAASGAYDSSGAVLKVGGVTRSVVFSVSFGADGATVSPGASAEIPAGNLTLTVSYAPPSARVNIVSLTQAAYDAITIKDSGTLYAIVG